MHVLTKVLVVFAAVMSLLLSALSVAYVANTSRLREAFEGAQTDVRLANAELAAAAQSFGEARAQLAADIEGRDAEIARLRGELGELDLSNERLRRELAKAALEVEAVNGQIVQLSVLGQTLAQTNENYRTEVRVLRDESVASSRRQLQLEETIANLEGDRQVLEAARRALEEQLVDASEELERLREGGSVVANAGGVSGQPVRIAELVTGEVLGVRSEGATGSTFVTIDLGRSDNIRENVELTISRGSQFVATMVVREVDSQQAVGIVTLPRDAEVRRGDRVSTSVSR